MVRVNVVVEGQTEETFIRDVLAPELARRNIFLTARAVETSRTKSKIYRGGLSSFARAKKDVETWILQDQTAYVTTMFDLYALPGDFPGFNVTGILSAVARAQALEGHLDRAINDQRFFSYIQTHEFEALLFCEPAVVDNVVALDPPQFQKLLAIKAKFKTPEDINDGPETSPSKRILALYPSYNKVHFGPQIIEMIGLARIRAQCKHFDAWLTKLESLVPPLTQPTIE